MKSLQNFISERLNESKESCSTISFNLTGIDGADETLKSIEEIENVVSINDKTVSISVCSNTVNKISTVKDTLDSLITAQRNGSRSTNDEQYAQKISGLESKMKELDNAIAELQADDSKEETPEADKAAEKDADKKEDDKE